MCIRDRYWLARAFPVTRHADAVVELQNAYANTEQGNSRTAALGRYLKYSKGLPTVSYGPDQAAQPHTSITLYGNEKETLAKDIAKWMGIQESEIVTLPKEDTSLPDVVIVIGKDFKVPGG